MLASSKVKILANLKYIKQIIVGVVVVAVIVAYAVYSRTSSPSSSYSVEPTQSSASSTPAAGAGTSATTTPVATAPADSSAQYKDGTYTGTPADAVFGTMQVAAVISGGKLTDVQFIQYPNTGSHTIQVNANSNPILRSEAIASQSANVDIVSGATQSSEGFPAVARFSMLAQAKV